MTLLERADLLRQLHEALSHADTARGQCVLIGGEAGAGKSALLAQFCAEAGHRAGVLIGSCDPVATPPPLGPFLEVASALDELPPASPVAWRGLFLRQTSTVILALEDIHWADEATLDLIRYLARRLPGIRLLLLATYRDDEVSGVHPVRALLGDLGGREGVSRMKVAPLSVEAVSVLTEGTGMDPRHLHRISGGNAFFVTELLRHSGSTVPDSIGDAVHARIARLSSSAGDLVRAFAVIGFRSTVGTLLDVGAVEASVLDEAVALGIVTQDGSAVSFRHELVRQAVLDSLPPGQSRELNRRVLDALRAVESDDLSRLAHHAELAGDPDASDLARRAGEHASRMGSHREAADHYARALRCGVALSDSARATLLEALAIECAATDRSREAVEARRAAVALWRELGNPARAALNIARLARPLVELGENASAEAALAEALGVLAGTGLPEEAIALAVSSRIRMLNRDNDVAIRQGLDAIELASATGSVEAEIVAENALGSALILVGESTEGVSHLRRSLELARREQDDLEVGNAFVNLGSALGEVFQFEMAEPYLLEGIAFAEARDIDSSRFYLLAWLALVRMYQGRWAEAVDHAREVIADRGSATISRIMAWLCLGRIRARRGDPDAWIALDHALELAAGTATLQRLGPVRAARAEAAWLQRDLPRCRTEAAAAYGLARTHAHPWHTGELGWWLRLAGDEDVATSGLAEPWALQHLDDYAGASAAWANLGCPYEAARAATFSGDAQLLREAHAPFTALGAAPMVAIAAARMREMGVSGIPRGPRKSTRQNAAGLTPREVDVLRHMTQGLRNAEIAERLVLSVRTVDHHVSTILSKLGARDRNEAIRFAAELDVLET